MLLGEIEREGGKKVHRMPESERDSKRTNDDLIGKFLSGFLRSFQTSFELCQS